MQSLNLSFFTIVRQRLRHYHCRKITQTPVLSSNANSVRSAWHDISSSHRDSLLVGCTVSSIARPHCASSSHGQSFGATPTRHWRPVANCLS